MMLYIKYESSGPCSLRQEDFSKLPFENLFLTPVQEKMSFELSLYNSM